MQNFKKNNVENQIIWEKNELFSLHDKNQHNFQ